METISGFLIVLRIKLNDSTEAFLMFSLVSLIIEVNLGTIIGKFSESYLVPQ